MIETLKFWNNYTLIEMAFDLMSLIIGFVCLIFSLTSGWDFSDLVAFVFVGCAVIYFPVCKFLIPKECKSDPFSAVLLPLVGSLFILTFGYLPYIYNLGRNWSVVLVYVSFIPYAFFFAYIYGRIAKRNY